MHRLALALRSRPRSPSDDRVATRRRARVVPCALAALAAIVPIRVARAGATSAASTPQRNLSSPATAPSSASLTASCTPSWIPTFGGIPGVAGNPYSDASACIAFDDGTGNALYVGGQFTVAGGVVAPHVARWNGSSWSAVGDGFDGDVRCFGVFDDGTGPALYAGGGFTHVGAVVVNGIAKWDGSTWSALGTGMSTPPISSTVLALLAFDDGSGPALYAGGVFTYAGGTLVSSLARWNGTSWSAVGGGSTGGVIHALCVHDDGGGPALYAGGEFTSIGATFANRIAKWDGAAWSPLGLGTNQRVLSLATFDDGGGPALIAGGMFTTVNGPFTPASGIAIWRGGFWSAYGDPHGAVGSLIVHDDGAGAGPTLHAGSTNVFRLSGSTWTTFGGGLSGGGGALATYDDGSGAQLVAAGGFTRAGGAPALGVARWNGATWSAFGAGTDAEVDALVVHDDGSGPALYAAGAFGIVGGTTAQNLARWNGSAWSTTGSAPNGPVQALASIDLGGGAELYVGGGFTQIGGVATNRIARWNGSTWSSLGGGLDNVPNAICGSTVGGTSALYTCGSFGAGRVLRWNGASWSTLGAFAGGIYFTDVSALASHDDGTGEALYAAGDFTSAGGVAASHVARWNGTSWSALGGGVNGLVFALATFDDGGGPALYAGGSFSTADGAPASCIAQWNGASWSSVGGGVAGGAAITSVHALAVVDDGSGPALYAGGDFATAGGVAARGIARWDGASWSALGGGVNDLVRTLAGFDDGTCNGPALIAGGYFTSALDSRDGYIARWDCVPSGPSGCFDAFCAGDGVDPLVTTACPCGNVGALGHGCASSTNASGAVLAASGSAGADTVALVASGMPASSACIYLQGDAFGDAVFGDGVRCADGALVRLRTRTNVGGASAFPDATDTTTLSQRGGVVPGGGAVRAYQTYYRNASASFCPPATFNVTNGWKVVW